MIKHWLISLLLLFTTISSGLAADYIGKEKKYFFSADNIGQSIIAHIQDEDKQIAVAQEYVKIMDQATGNVSIEDLFTLCRVAGFNTYKQDGYDKCRAFITTMLENAQIEADSGIMGGFCPGLDENGKNPNNLQTITDKTRIGDTCKSTNIYAGEVVFKKGYNCTCLAYACNPGFYIKGGACHTEVADSSGNCLRKEYDGNDSNNSKEKCFAFCGQMGDKLGCKANTSIWFPKENKCLCNATYDEVDAVRQKRIESLPYKAVCGADKGKTGGTEYCIKDIFNWTNVGMIQATGLAAEYALIKHGKVVHCSDKYRQESNDDWVQCTTDDKKTFYEFKFDDVVESVDARIQGDLTRGICQIHGLMAMDSNGSGYYDSCSGACGEALKKSAKKFGLNPVDKALYNSTYCSLQDRRLGKNDGDKLAKIEGIDNYIFYHGIQIQGNQDLIRKLRQYIQSTGKYEIKSFTCDKGVGKIKNGNIETDDILRCYLNGQPIDFVFDDNSEMWKTYQKAGKQAINCIVQGGTYSGKGCLGLSEQVCLKVAAQDKKSCPECQAAHWDANLEQCILPAGAAARNLEQGIKVGTIVVVAVGAAAVTVATGGAAGVGAALLVVEVVGAGVETVATAKIQQAAVDFLNASNKCKDATCAESMIKNNFQRLANMQNDFAAAEVNAIDSEMARLYGLIPDNSEVFNLTKLSDSQLSMFAAGSWEPEQVWRAIGVTMQMASLFTSIGKWILGKVPRLAKTTAVVTTKMQNALPAATAMKALPAHADDAAKLALGASDDAAKLALGTGDDAAKLALGAGDDAARLALPAAADDALKALPAHVDDEVKALTAGSMSRADAKHLQDIAEREAKRAAGTATKHEREMAKADHQLRNQIYNRYAGSIGSGENIEMAGKAVMKQEQIAAVEADLYKAQQSLNWATEHAGQVSRAEMVSRQAKVDMITQQLADMGVTYNKVDNAVTASASAVRATETTATTAVRTADKADNVANALSKVDDVAKPQLALPAPSTTTNVAKATEGSGTFAEIGVKESVVNGKVVYTDVKTGKELSTMQVTNKIPTSWNEEMAQYGLRQVELSNGSVRYMDISAEGGNRFISQEAANQRISQMLAATSNKADNVVSTASKVDDVAKPQLALPAHVDDAANTASDAARNAGRAADATSDAARATTNAARNVGDLDSAYRIGQPASTRAEILQKWGLGPNATDAEIKKRWYDLAKKFHEDKAGADDVLRNQLKGIMSDINAEHDLLGSLPKVEVLTTDVVNNADNMARALPMPAGTTVPPTPPVTPVVTPVTNGAATTQGFSTFGHDLIGIMAGIRAGDRASQ